MPKISHTNWQGRWAAEPIQQAAERLATHEKVKAKNNGEPLDVGLVVSALDRWKLIDAVIQSTPDESQQRQILKSDPVYALTEEEQHVLKCIGMPSGVNILRRKDQDLNSLVYQLKERLGTPPPPTAPEEQPNALETHSNFLTVEEIVGN